MKLLQAVVGHEPQYFHATTANISAHAVEYHFMVVQRTSEILCFGQSPMAPSMSHTARKQER